MQSSSNPGERPPRVPRGGFAEQTGFGFQGEVTEGVLGGGAAQALALSAGEDQHLAESVRAGFEIGGGGQRHGGDGEHGQQDSRAAKHGGGRAGWMEDQLGGRRNKSTQRTDQEGNTRARQVTGGPAQFAQVVAGLAGVVLCLPAEHALLQVIIAAQAPVLFRQRAGGAEVQHIQRAQHRA